MGQGELIEELVRLGYLRTPRIIEAFRAIDRKHFVSPEFADEAYENYPLPIGYGQTISQPLTVAFMLELLDVHPGEVVLEVGGGSGWQAALLGSLVGNEGRVITVDRLPELCRFAEEHIRRYSFIERGIVVVVLGNGSQGVPPKFLPPKGFDKIIAAASGRSIPEVWKRQLKTGGRIVAPVGNSIFALDKLSEREFSSTEHPGFAFVPLIEDTGRG